MLKELSIDALKKITGGADSASRAQSDPVLNQIIRSVATSGKEVDDGTDDPYRAPTEDDRDSFSDAYSYVQSGRFTPLKS